MDQFSASLQCSKWCPADGHQKKLWVWMTFSLVLVLVILTVVAALKFPVRVSNSLIFLTSSSHPDAIIWSALIWTSIPSKSSIASKTGWQENIGFFFDLSSKIWNCKYSCYIMYQPYQCFVPTQTPFRCWSPPRASSRAKHGLGRYQNIWKHIQNTTIWQNSCHRRFQTKFNTNQATVRLRK